MHPLLRWWMVVTLLLLLPPHAAIDAYIIDTKRTNIVVEYFCRMLMLLPAVLVFSQAKKGGA